MNSTDAVTKIFQNVKAYADARDALKIDLTEKGAASGVAELDSTGKVPSSQLPSYVDDVLDGYYNAADGKFYTDSAYTTEIIGESGKIYVSLDSSIQYRWTGTAFAAIGGALTLGETASTAYRGDRGKIAYDDSQENKANIVKLFGNLTATKEENPATASHSSGDLLLINGVLHIATADIDVGDALAVGTNVAATTVEEQLLRRFPTRKLTQAQYDALTPAEKAADVVYFITDAGGSTTGLQLGETSSTAYRGDRGKAAYDDSQANKVNIAKILESLAVAETSPSTAAHDEGDLLLWNGSLYEAAADIDVGDALVSGGNLTPTTVAVQLAGMQGSLTMDSVPTDGSTNPVESNGIYDEFAMRYPTRKLTQAQYDALSPAQKAENVLYFITDASGGGGGGGGGGSLPSGGTAGQVLTKKSATDGDAEWRDPQDTSALEGDFAGVETDPLTNAYAVGEMFVIDGQLYKAKTAIAAGDALDVGVNADETTVAAEIAAAIAKIPTNALLKDGSVAADKLLIGTLASNTSLGNNAFAIGTSNTSSGNFTMATGIASVATGDAAHAQGNNTKATGQYAHAEGHFTTASGPDAHAEGFYTESSGQYTHAEGNNTKATGQCAHAEGFYTVAGYAHQLVTGRYNDNKSTTLFEVGNGTGAVYPSNAFEVYGTGDIVASGKVTATKGIEVPNDSGYYAVTKRRTVGSAVHRLTLGVAESGASTIEHYPSESGAKDTRMELASGKITAKVGTFWQNGHEVLDKGMILEKSVTATTDANGCVSLGLGRTATVFAVLPEDNSTQYLCAPWYDPVGKEWMARVAVPMTMAAVTGVSVAVTARYLA